MSDNIPFSNLDFESVRSGLKDYLSSQDKFKDYDFEGSNIAVLLDVLAYNTFQNNFYSNMVFSEMFLDSAQLRGSVVSHAKELNYLPSSRHSSQSILDISLSVTNNVPSVTVPSGTKFEAKCGQKTYQFVTAESYVVYPENGLYTLSGIEVFEGKVTKELYKATGDATQKFLISNENVDTNSIRVHVRDNVNTSSNLQEYVRSQNLFGVGSNDKVFYVEPYGDNQYRIVFGQDVFGKQPVVGNVVEIEYRVCKGDEPNGAYNFSPTGAISGYNAIVTYQERAANGSERESEESIKFFAPKSIQIQDRAITESDYEILLKNNFSEIQAISVYGGEELSPPQYGRVAVAVDVNNAEGVSESNKTKYSEYLKQRCPIGIEPIVVSPQFMYVSVESSIKYNTKTTNKSSGDIRDAVNNAILTHSKNNLEDFKRTLRYSKLLYDIDNSDSNIISNDTNVLAIIPLNPTLNEVNRYDVRFSNRLTTEHRLAATTTLENYKYAISSSVFVYRNTECFMIDNGNGEIDIIKSTPTGFSYVERNIGYIDYETGDVSIVNFAPSAFEGSEVKMYGRIYSKDIVSPKDRIISIREEDISISAVGV